MLFLLWSLVAHADDVADVTKFFDDFVERTNKFEDLSSLYADDAAIIVLREGQSMELVGAQYKKMLASAMPMAKERGDTSSYADIAVAAQGDAYRVTATRTAAIKCFTGKYELDVVKRDDGWQIVRELSESVSLSQCAPSKKLGKSLAAMAAGIQPHLPLDLDADTKLEAVTVVGSAVVYSQRLHGLAAAELDISKLVPMLRQVGIQNACGAPDMRALIDAGGSVRYIYVDRDGTPLVKVDIQPGLCP